jgi:hypothetical protein
MKLIDTLKHERDGIYKTCNVPVTALPDRKMQVCKICGAKLVQGDTERRQNSHLEGKQHQGWELIRRRIQEFHVSYYLFHGVATAHVNYRTWNESDSPFVFVEKTCRFGGQKASKRRGSLQRQVSVVEFYTFTARLIFNVASLVVNTIVVIEDLLVITSDVIMTVESVGAAEAIVVTRTDLTSVGQIVKIETTTENLDLGIALRKSGLTIVNETTMRMKSESTRNNDDIKRGGFYLSPLSSSLCSMVTSFSDEGIIPLCT